MSRVKSLKRTKQRTERPADFRFFSSTSPGQSAGPDEVIMHRTVCPARLKDEFVSTSAGRLLRPGRSENGNGTTDDIPLSSPHWSPPDGRSTPQARHDFVALARRAQRMSGDRHLEKQSASPRGGRRFGRRLVLSCLSPWGSVQETGRRAARALYGQASHALRLATWREKRARDHRTPLRPPALPTQLEFATTPDGSLHRRGLRA